MTIRSLDPDTRMLVEEQAANLTQATRRAEAQLDERSGLWQIQVPGTNLRLDYSVDERKHQVKLISVAGQR